MTVHTLIHDARVACLNVLRADGTIGAFVSQWVILHDGPNVAIGLGSDVEPDETDIRSHGRLAAAGQPAVKQHEKFRFDLQLFVAELMDPQQNEARSVEYLNAILNAIATNPNLGLDDLESARTVSKEMTQSLTKEGPESLWNLTIECTARI